MIDINPNIRHGTVNTKNGGKVVKFYNISEDDLQHICFVTNTDSNNNFGYLEQFSVYTHQNQSLTIDIPGLFPIIRKYYHISDKTAFMDGKKKFHPFKSLFRTGLTIPQYIDQQTDLMHWLPKTLGIQKYFSVTFNPDSSCYVAGPVSDCGDCCEDVLCIDNTGGRPNCALI